jgi:hypothetical protein
MGRENNFEKRGGRTMKKIFILSILLALSLGTAYGEIIRITNGPFNKLYIVVNEVGHVSWVTIESPIGTDTIYKLHYYNGSETITIDQASIRPPGDGNTISGNQLVYYKMSYEHSPQATQLILFDGQTHTLIAEKGKDGITAIGYGTAYLCNGFVAFLAGTACFSL